MQCSVLRCTSWLSHPSQAILPAEVCHLHAIARNARLHHAAAPRNQSLVHTCLVEHISPLLLALLALVGPPRGIASTTSLHTHASMCRTSSNATARLVPVAVLRNGAGVQQQQHSNALCRALMYTGYRHCRTGCSTTANRAVSRLLGRWPAGEAQRARCHVRAELGGSIQQRGRGPAGAWPAGRS